MNMKTSIAKTSYKKTTDDLTALFEEYSVPIDPNGFFGKVFDLSMHNFIDGFGAGVDETYSQCSTKKKN